MKAIVTIFDNNNYGNRLQNYALEMICKSDRLNDTITIKNDQFSNNLNSKYILLKKIKKYVTDFLFKLKYYNRVKNFNEFNKNINLSKRYMRYIPKKMNKYSKIIVGSDQVWNPSLKRLSDFEVLALVDNNKKISYAASFGISDIDDKSKERIKRYLNKETFPAISVREKQGKEIIEKLTGRNDVEITLDPTLLLSKEDWIKVEKKPKFSINERYILTYFLGESTFKKEISKLARINNLTVINLNDKNNLKYYSVGPSEFLYLIHNAELIFTDSFHACVFSVIYDKPFYVFNRNQNGIRNMNSRLDTFINMIEQEYRKVNNFSEINEEKVFNTNYEKCKNIINQKKEKSIYFLKKTLGDENE